MTTTNRRDFLGTSTESAAIAAAQTALGPVHLGEIAYRTGGRLDFNPVTETFADNDATNEMLAKSYREPNGLPVVALKHTRKQNVTTSW